MEIPFLRFLLAVLLLLSPFALVFIWMFRQQQKIAALRKQSEETLREGESKLKQILENIHEIFWISSVDGEKIIYVTPMYEKITGRSCQSLYEKPASWLEVVHPEDRDQVTQAVDKAVDYQYDQEYRIIRPDGSLRWIRDRSFPIRNQQGEVYRVAGITEDMTERRLMEEGIKRLNEDLKTANKDLESFSYSVSHDLRAPLRTIDGFSRLLLEKCAEKLAPEGKQYLNFICDNAQKMDQLIHDLLEFSRLGRQEIKKSEIDMKGLFKTVFEELRKTAPEERKINFRMKELPPAFGDPSLIRQVVVNFISNGIKYTKHKETALIEAGSKIEGNQNVYYVKDNGAGFDMKYVGKLFGVFQRLHSAEQFEGTGVGLSIVQRIIYRHGGRVWAEAKVNEGAAFYFTLPIPHHLF